jgi:anti-sigma factor RsiW
MTNDTNLSANHIGEQLSGYIDGELTQQERQRIRLHCEACSECRENLKELETLRRRIGETRLSVIGEDKWRENMNDPTVQTSRNIGWLIFIAGLLAAFGVALLGFITATDLTIGEKLIVFGVYGGLALLLFSVLRQRLIERKSDKYKDVEI